MVKRILDASLSTNTFFRLSGSLYYRDYEPGFYFTYDGLTGAFSGEPDTEDHTVKFWQPLHLAARHGHSDIVDILLDKDSWVDAPSFRFSPLERPLAKEHWKKHAATFGPMRRP